MKIVAGTRNDGRKPFYFEVTVERLARSSSILRQEFQDLTLGRNWRKKKAILGLMLEKLKSAKVIQ